MNFEETKKMLEKAGQAHLLRFYDELSGTEKENLLREIEKIDFDSIDIHYKISQSDNITPIRAATLKDTEPKRDEYRKKGIEAIRTGKVAAVLLAGGQGTRLGFDGPKGTLNVGLTREVYLFGLLVENLKKNEEAAGRAVPLYIMTSEKNDKATREFFEEHDYFGRDRSQTFFFIQEMAPATDMEGKIFLEDKGHVSLSPNGNGGWFVSLKKAGLLEQIKKSGAEYLNLFSVDNPLQHIADPCYIGALLDSGHPIASMVVKKANPEEKVGVMCLRDGRPSIVEYIDITPEMAAETDENGELVYNYGVILNYIFNIEALEKIAGKRLPLHVVSKKIPHIDENGNFVKPEEANGHKFEQLVLDMVEMMDDCLVYEERREDCFSPIKNAHGNDSLDTAREALRAKGVVL